MAIPRSEDHAKAKEWNQTPSADDLEKVIDYMLSDPFYRMPKGDSDPDIGYVSIRLPDATIISDEVIAEVDKRYKAVGWLSVSYRYGNTAETEYQTHIFITYYK